MKLLNFILGVFLVIAVFVIAYLASNLLNMKNNSKVATSENTNWQAPDVITSPSVESQMTEEEKKDEEFLATQSIKPLQKGTVRVPILLYHHIAPPPGDETDSYYVSPETFEKQMKWLAENKYNVISIDTLVNYLITGKSKPEEKSVIITFDDGTVGQYKYAFPILKKYHYNATFFMVPIWTDKGTTDKNSDYMSWDNLKELSDYGMKIGSHNYSHIKMGPAEEDELIYEPTESQKILEEKLKRKINIYAYPGGSFDARAIGAIENIGYKAAFSTEKNIDHKASELFHLGRMHIDNDIPYFKGRVQGKWFK